MIYIVLDNITNLNDSLQVGDMIYATTPVDSGDLQTSQDPVGAAKIVGILRKISESAASGNIMLIVDETHHVGAGNSIPDDDGITATELELFKAALSKKYIRRIVSAEKVAIGWLETRSDKEMKYYPKICRIAHDIIKEGF